MKRSLKVFIIFMFIALLLSSCSALGGASTPESTPIPVVTDNGAVISQGNLVPKDYMYLAFPGGGHIAEILVKQGDKVTAGQVLARLGDRQQYQANLTAAQLELANAQQSLDELNKNSDLSAANAWLTLLDAKQHVIEAQNAWKAVDTEEYQQKIDDADIKVSDMRTRLDDAQTEFDKYANLATDNPTRKAAETALNDAQDNYDQAVHEHDQLIIDRDRAQANLILAQAQQTQAQNDYDATRNGPDPEKLSMAQKNLDVADTHVTAAQAALDNLDLKAPFTGTVVDVNVSVGELVSSDKWAVLVADFSEWYVDTSDLTEQEVVKLSMGQAATVIPDALPDLHLSSNISEISDMFYVSAGDVLYHVRLKLNQPDPALRWGMTVEVDFAP
ncbi:MAG: efflux RND transporter periplasmic adaptor subunit [Anaerolineales bacterium]|jgi:multidrug efflux pump subunit AcrA (membrane-fusion protein)